MDLNLFSIQFLIIFTWEKLLRIENCNLNFWFQFSFLFSFIILNPNCNLVIYHEWEQKSLQGLELIQTKVMVFHFISFSRCIVANLWLAMCMQDKLLFHCYDWQPIGDDITEEVVKQLWMNGRSLVWVFRSGPKWWPIRLWDRTRRIRRVYLNRVLNMS